MKFLLIVTIISLASTTINAKCPDKGDQLLKTFNDAYEEFQKTTCKKCDGRVGETKKQLKWIAEILFTTILSPTIIGVTVDESVHKWRPMIEKCAETATPAEKDFCHEKQQSQFYTCLKMKLIEIMANQKALKWAKDNCDAIQDHMLTNEKQIKNELKKIGKKYITTDNCVGGE